MVRMLKIKAVKAVCIVRSTLLVLCTSVKVSRSCYSGLSIPIRALVWTCPIAGIVGTSDWISFNPRLPSDVLPPRLHGATRAVIDRKISGPTTFTDWKDFSHPTTDSTLKLFKSSPLPFPTQLTTRLVSFLSFYPSIPVRVPSQSLISDFPLCQILHWNTSADSKIPRHETEAPSLNFPTFEQNQEELN